MGSKSSGNNINILENNNDINNKKVDYWRKYFRTSSSDIFDIIENAIKVAALDCPKEYRIRKARIAELLFSCMQTHCPHFHDHHHGDDHGDDVHGDHGDLSKESKVNSNSRDVDVDVNCGGGGGGGDDEGVDVEGGVMGLGSDSFSYGDAEALTDLIEEEKGIIIEVLRIKDVLYNSHDESDSVLYESLRRLQLMHLTINILKETEIGKAVNCVRKHSSKDVRHLARSLIDGWKIIVDEWVKSTQELTEGGTPDSINPSTVDEEEGLPSPPMDEGVFFSTQIMDFNQFFDGMDDDGNPQDSREFNKNRVSFHKPSTVKPIAPKRTEESHKETTPISKDNRVQQMKIQPPLPKPNKPSNTQSGPGRPLKPNGNVKLSPEWTARPNPENPVVRRRPTPQPEKLSPSNDGLVQEKLKATKRKLQEQYQQAENAKKSRSIRVMEIQDLPKQGVVNKHPHAKFGNQNRHWANGRK